MKNGYRVLDSDIHVIEPMSLWGEYLDPRFRDRAPRRSEHPGAICEIEGRTIPPHMDREDRQRAWGLRMRNARARLERERPEEDRVMGATRPEAMLRAMEVEGIDVAVVFRSAKRKVLCDNCARLYRLQGEPA